MSPEDAIEKCDYLRGLPPEEAQILIDIYATGTDILASENTASKEFAKNHDLIIAAADKETKSQEAHEFFNASTTPEQSDNKAASAVESDELIVTHTPVNFTVKTQEIDHLTAKTKRANQIPKQILAEITQSSFEEANKEINSILLHDTNENVPSSKGSDASYQSAAEHRLRQLKDKHLEQISCEKTDGIQIIDAFLNTAKDSEPTRSIIASNGPWVKSKDLDQLFSLAEEEDTFSQKDSSDFYEVQGANVLQSLYVINAGEQLDIENEDLQDEADVTFDFEAVERVFDYAENEQSPNRTLNSILTLESNLNGDHHVAAESDGIDGEEIIYSAEVMDTFHKIVEMEACDERLNSDGTIIDSSSTMNQRFNAEPVATDDNEPNAFEKFVADKSPAATATIIDFDTVIENAEEQPLEETLVQLAFILKSDSFSDAEVKDFPLELKECLILHIDDADASINEFTPELTSRMLDIVRICGYENPSEVLTDFVSRHDINFAVQAIRFLEELTRRYEQRKPAIVKIHDPLQSSFLHTIESKLGKTVLLFAQSKRTVVNFAAAA